jgi:hypothetical protein
MTFNMVQNYVTSIVNDASGALGSRQAVFGATYPFPARYTDRYMPESGLDSYVTRSYLFGGPWIFMNKLTEMKPADLEWAALEIARYKRARRIIRDGRVLHPGDPPEAGKIDAIGAYDASTDRVVAVVTRDGAPGDSFVLRIPGLRENGGYRVEFADDARQLVFTGSQLAVDGVAVRLPRPKSAEIVWIEPN